MRFLKSFVIIFFSFLLIFLSNFSNAQPNLFAGLTGNPVNTTGWVLTGAAYANGDNIMLCPNVNTSSGAIYYNQSLDLNSCSEWEVEYDYRIFDGNGADGIAMWFLESPPTGFSIGGGIGMPNNAKGIAVILDQFNNGCSSNSIQIVCLDGTFPYTTDCGQGIVARVNNVAEVRQNNYNTCKVTYNQGNIQVFINGTLRVSGFCPTNLTGYFGFSSSTGANRDNHTIKNIDIIVNQPSAFAGIDRSICSGNITQLGETPNPIYNYQWFPSTGLNNANIANPTFSINNNTGNAATYSFTVTTNIIGSQCFATDTVLVIVYSIKRDTIVENICSGNSINFFGNFYTNPGFYNATTSSQSGCDSIVTLQLTVNSSLYDTSIVTVCFGESFTFQGTNYNTSGIYSFNYTNINGCDSLHTIILNIKPPFQDTVVEYICEAESFTLPSGIIVVEAGYYTSILQSQDGCDSVVTTQLITNAILYDTTTVTICSGESYFFEGTYYNTGGIYSFNYNSVTGCDSLHSIILSIRPPIQDTIKAKICEKEFFTLPDGTIVYASGIYQSSLLSVNNCDSIIVTEIIIDNSNSSLEISIEPSSMVIEMGDSVTLNVIANDNNLNYRWFPNSTLSCNSCNAPVFFGDSSVVLYVIVTDINGCIDTSMATVEVVSNNGILYVPNAFTPNGDNINDGFRAFAKGVKTFYMMIYNRWGEKVFETSDINTEWDGNYLGKDALPGVYIYHINVVYLNSSNVRSKGSVTLIK